MVKKLKRWMCKWLGHDARYFGSSNGDGTSHPTKYYIVCIRCGKHIEEGNMEGISEVKGLRA